MDNLFPYTTLEQQILKLKSQQLTFEDEEVAKLTLKTYGYYNIINGYRDPYIIREYGHKKYCPDVTFEQIFSLFRLDHMIRDGVLLAMIDLEEHLRAVVADIIAEDFGTEHNTYLANNNYRDKYVSNPRFRRNNVLRDMRQTAETSYAQPIRYYRESHGIVPPWILLKGVYFATLVNLIRFFKAPQREKLIHALYGSNVNEQNIDEYKDILSDTLFVCLEYRNLAAHGGRIYNHIPNSTIRCLENSTLKKGLPQLLHVLSLFDYSLPYERLDTVIVRAINEYCPLYPDDLDRLERAMGLHIIAEDKVWVNEKTRKYHSNRYCSGSSNCIHKSLDEAQKLGYVPCKKCFN